MTADALPYEGRHLRRMQVRVFKLIMPAVAVRDVARMKVRLVVVGGRGAARSVGNCAPAALCQDCSNESAIKQPHPVGRCSDHASDLDAGTR